MKPYPLAALLGLRIFRQDKAMRAVQNCEKELSEARRDVRKAIKKHEEFLIWLAEEEVRRYDSIMETEMNLEDVDDFKAGLLEIRGRESQYLENILKARNQVQICKDNLAQAKRDLVAAQKGTMKIEVHRDRWLELARQDAERAEEMELEDFMPPQNDLFGDKVIA